ncbi:MAG: transporter related [Lachnospiraceae bacterium]|jgi:ABC-2 type transport system ATP-binding protein|nr:transporter related [Lachnospiraceae bacterium]
MLLRINNLNIQYGKMTALNITTPITIEKGDRIGIIGSNGAGKSTLIKSLLGIVNYTGSIDSTITPFDMAVHMQFNEYTDSMAVKHIMEAILQTRIRKNQKLQELITYFEFEKCLNKKFKVLSGGQKQRFTIILVMMQEAPLTFYDEVTSGLDFETRQKLVEKLVSWYQDKEAGLCVVSHYYEELEQLTNKLLILEQGKVVDFGHKDALFKKYCGRAIIVIDNNEKNQLLTKKYAKLASPNHYIVLACNTQEIESEITTLFIQNNVNYKRSNNDIEMIFINAKEQAVSGGIYNE